jgi:hypothetical protein
MPRTTPWSCLQEQANLLLVAKMQKVYAQRIECPAWLSLSQQLSTGMSVVLPSRWIGINYRRERADADA